MRRLQARKQFGGLWVVPVQLQGLLHLARGSGDVAAAQQRDGQVEVVVGVVGVDCNHLYEERRGVLALAAGGDALIVDHLGQRQAGGDEGEGGGGLGVSRDVEARQPAIESGLQRKAIRGRHLGQSSCGSLVLKRRVLLLAQRQQRRCVAGRLGDRGLEALQPLVGGGRGGAANVVLERAEAHAAGRSEKGLFGYGEVRVHALRHLPRNGVLHIEEARQFAGILQRRGHA